MTNPCLEEVNPEYITYSEPNVMQVPYTNGISRTFENTLITTLIVFRDVSPTLSLWEAFKLRTVVSLVEPIFNPPFQGILFAVTSSYSIRFITITVNRKQ